MPYEVSAARGQFVAEVVANVPLCREHFRLDLLVEGFPATQPGQFVQLACRPVGSTDPLDREVHVFPPLRWEVADTDLLVPTAVLRRPFSLAGRHGVPGGAILQVIHRVVGIGTQWLAAVKPGDRVGVLGPLGNTFTLPADGRVAVLVGGGVGIPPMLYLAAALRGRRAVAFCGATTRDLLPLTVREHAIEDSGCPSNCIAEFAEHGILSVISTDDGTLGSRGFVTQALEVWLDSAGAEIAPRSAVIYTCGPEAMMKRVAEIAAARGIDCQVAVERAMACGMGTCQSCCIRVRKPDPAAAPLPGKDWCYRLACTDGPIFHGRELLW